MPEKKILLIEDDKDILQVLNVRLRSQGYQVAAASDAISAVSVARLSVLPEGPRVQHPDLDHN